MKTTIRSFFVFFSILLFPIFSFSQKDISSLGYPSYESVVKHFYKNYLIPVRPESLHFEKRPDGYYVSKSPNYSNPERVEREMLWSRETNKFNALKLYKTGTGDYDESYMQSMHLRFYQIHEHGYCPYNGYPGWQKQVIDDFGKKENLADTLLYGLARAYSTFAGNMISGNLGNNDPSVFFNLPKGKNSMNQEQLKQYRKNTRLARSAFYKLHQQNPDFETVVGKVYIKYCNEVMWNFLMLQYHQNEEEARKELKPDLYDEFYINAAKNFLNSCPPNAILFTYGDNDTYPLLYVQAQLGFRTDVLIANTSLLAVDRYIDHLREGVFDAKPYPAYFDPSFYQDQNNIQIFSIHPSRGTEGLEKINLLEALDFIKKESSRIPLSNTQSLAHFPSDNFSLKINKEKIISKKIVPKEFQDSIVTEMTWTIPRSTIIRNDLMLLAAIAESNWNRPICIGMTCRTGNFVGMNNYFHLEGLVYRLFPTIAIGVSPYLHAGINAEETYKKLMTEFFWSGIEKIESRKSIYYRNYTFLFLETAKQLIKDGKNKKVEKLLDRFFEIFPNKVKKHEGIISSFVEQYFILGKNKPAEKVGLQIIDNFSKSKTRSKSDTNTILQLEQHAKTYNSIILQKAIKKINW